MCLEAEQTRLLLFIPSFIMAWSRCSVGWRSATTDTKQGSRQNTLHPQDTFSFEVIHWKNICVSHGSDRHLKCNNLSNVLSSLRQKWTVTGGEKLRTESDQSNVTFWYLCWYLTAWNENFMAVIRGKHKNQFLNWVSVSFYQLQMANTNSKKLPALSL